MNTLIEQTKRCLGDLAHPLLDNGSIVPVVITADNRKIPTAKWGQPIDPNQRYRFNALGFVTGERSGITVIDYDADVPDTYNVKTRRGAHVWVEASPLDKTSTDQTQHIDVRGHGGYAVFFSPHHNIKSTSLHQRTTYKHLINTYTLTYTTTTINNLVNSNIGHDNDSQSVLDCRLVERTDYMERVWAAGYEVDEEIAVSRMVGRMLKAEEGMRNGLLFKYASNFYTIGANTDLLRSAAERAGLSNDEITKTMISAIESPLAWDVYGMACRWQEAAAQEFDSPVAEIVKREAIYQHSLQPLINVQRLSEENGINYRTFTRRLRKYLDANILTRTNSGARQTNGNKMPSNFKLVCP